MLSERQIKRWQDPSAPLTPARRSQNALKDLYPFSVGEPGHIASLVVYLASEDARMITGTTIAADGGKSSYLKVMP